MATQKRNHEDTWGASEAAKAEWEKENGEDTRKSTEKTNKKTEKEQGNA